MDNNVKTKVLEITNEVYKKYEHRLVKKVPKYIDSESGITLRHIAELGLQDPNVTDGEKEKLSNFIKSGLLDEMEDQVDDEVAKEYEKDLELTLFNAVQDGTLPKHLLKVIKENSIYATKNKRNSKKTNGEKTNASRRVGSTKGGNHKKNI